MIRFERLTDNGALWATKYEGDSGNIFDVVFDQWADIQWLKSFFETNISDLERYFHITDIDSAIFDTLEDAFTLRCMILDLNPDSNLDVLFRPLENYRSSEMVLSREKAKGFNQNHPSWLRLYAIRLESGCYIITGGTIKLTAAMQDREHTLRELNRLNQVRTFLVSIGIFDYDSFEAYNEE